MPDSQQEPLSAHPTRRRFLQCAAATGLGFAGLQTFLSQPLAADDRKARFDPGYGPLVRDPNKIFDLPRGFEYRIISRARSPMSDGFVVPARPDGMATFAGPKGLTILVRNHEVSSSAGPEEGPFGANAELQEKLASWLIYDRGQRGRPPLGGGTTTLVYDTKRKKVVREFLSLTGTIRNCAGGATPWGTWVTCEETVERKGRGRERDHGYCFEVRPTTEPAVATPVALKGLGRFNHEAIVVDPESGCLYLTEDRPDGLFYRFVPKVKGKLRLGGRLQALAAKGEPRLDTRNWRSPRIEPGQPLEVSWIDLEDVDAPRDDLRFRGRKAGAACFARGEGMWWSAGENERGSAYFCCTIGGKKMLGQVWRYVPSEHEGTAREQLAPGTLELFVEPNDRRALAMADNITVAPWGDLIVCEDGGGVDRLVGISPAGGFYELGRNARSRSELAGACFSPDGSALFVNNWGDGLTFAITGPWGDLHRKRAPAGDDAPDYF